MEKLMLILVGIIFLIAAIWGLTQGAIRIAVSLAATIFTMAIVMALTPKVAGIVKDRTTIDDSIQKAVVETVTPKDEQKPETLDPEKMAAEGKKAGQVKEKEQNAGEPDSAKQEELIKQAKFPEFIEQSVLSHNDAATYDQMHAKTFSEYVGNYVSDIIINMLTFLVVYVFVRMFVRIIMNMIDFISELPVLHLVNRLAGGVTGLGVGLVAVWIIFVIITIFYGTSFGKMCLEQIKADQFLSLLYDNNILLKLLSVPK